MCVTLHLACARKQLQLTEGRESTRGRNNNPREGGRRGRDLRLEAEPQGKKGAGRAGATAERLLGFPEWLSAENEEAEAFSLCECFSSCLRARCACGELKIGRAHLWASCLLAACGTASATPFSPLFSLFAFLSFLGFLGFFFVRRVAVVTPPSPLSYFSEAPWIKPVCVCVAPSRVPVSGWKQDTASARSSQWTRKNSNAEAQQVPETVPASWELDQVILEARKSFVLLPNNEYLVL